MAEPIDPTVAKALDAGLVRLTEIGNLSTQQAVENSGRLSGMFGIRAAQTNPIEAHAIGSLDQSANPGNALASSLVSALQAAFANLAHITPATQAPPASK